MINQQSFLRASVDIDSTALDVAQGILYKGKGAFLLATSQKQIKLLRSSIVECLRMLVWKTSRYKDLTGYEKRVLMRICERSIRYNILPQYGGFFYLPTIMLDAYFTCKPELYLRGRRQNTQTKLP